MPEASEAQKRVMDNLGIRHNKATSMRDASMRITAKLGDGRLKAMREPLVRDEDPLDAPYGTVHRCTDCDEPLTPTEKLSLMPDGTTAGTYPKRPVCHHCESGYRVTKEKEGF